MSRSELDIALLDEILSTLPQDNLPMTASELDGYVIGILACPDLIPPSEWLPHVWGINGEADFPDLIAAQTTISAVMAHYNSIALAMTQSPLIEPIYEMDANCDEVLWEGWVSGFSRSLKLRPETWQGVIENAPEDARASLIFLMALQDINEGNSGLTEDEIDQVDLEAPDLIPNCVAAILSMLRSEHSLAAGSARRERSQRFN